MRYLLREGLPNPKLFVARSFFDLASCHRLGQALREGGPAPATISGLGGVDITDERRRRTSRVTMPNTDRLLVEGRLLALLPDLERYFDLKLSGLQRAQFLRYRRGDFFRPHRDSSDHPSHGPELRSRTLSLVLFLNGQTRLPEMNTYCGGELRLFQLDDHPNPVGCITGEPGLLVAFASEVLHEVRPVTHGERQTVVAWYTKRED